MENGTKLLNALQANMIEFANEKGIDLQKEFGTVFEFKKFVIGFAFKLLTQNGMAIDAAFNLLFGSNAYEQLAEEIWNSARG